MYRRIEVDRGYEGLEDYGVMAHAMCESGLPDSKTLRGRTKAMRHFFTEYGWKKCGSNILSALRSRGTTAKVMTMKERCRDINILYLDRWQVIVHFNSKKSRLAR